MKTRILITLIWLCTICSAETITYRIVEYNADAATFVLAACGQRPTGSYAEFWNKYGATTGNRYNQIPRNQEASLWLEGWEGCTIEAVTLWMCSNRSSGTAALNVKTADAVLFTMHAKEFADEAWFGHWVSKDFNTYVPIRHEMTDLTPVGEDGEVEINLKGGTPEGSVYLQAVTIDYTPASAVGTESPLGWRFEKLEKKSTLSEGDVVMLYRSGDAAGDIDGIDTSHYLDAIGLQSTGNVWEPFVEYFTLSKTSDGAYWTLEDQYGRTLGATAKQALAWDNGTTSWSITLGYDGATITSSNTKYGTLRYNAPAESYPRFWNYDSTSLPLPYLYRRIGQQPEVKSTGLTLSHTLREVDMSLTDTLIIRHALTPATTTDWRVAWSTDRPEVATVSGGVVMLHAPGTAIITARSMDGGSTAQCTLHVTQTPASLIAPSHTSQAAEAHYTIDGRSAPPHTSHSIYLQKGRKQIK